MKTPSLEEIAGIPAANNPEANVKELIEALEAAHFESWIHNAGITDDIEALRDIALDYCEWWNMTALPVLRKHGRAA